MTDFDYEDAGYKAFIAGKGGESEKRKGILGWIVGAVAVIGTLIFRCIRIRRGLEGNPENLSELGDNIAEAGERTTELEQLTGEIGDSLQDLGGAVSEARISCDTATDYVEELRASATNLRNILQKYSD